MALIDCPHCGYEINSQASRCKYCGYVLDPTAAAGRHRRTNRDESTVMAFLQFRQMATPALIKWAWWLIAISCGVTGLLLPLLVTNSGAVAVAIFLGGIIGSRIICELLIITFAIHANLTDIRAALLRASVEQPTFPRDTMAVPPATTVPAVVPPA